MKLSQLKSLKGAEPEGNSLDKMNAMLEEERNAPRPYKSKPANTPSVLGSKCFRKIYYSYWRVPSDFPLDARSIRIFQMGDAVEEMLRDWLKKIGRYIPYRNKGNGEISKIKNGEFPIKSSKWRIRRGYMDNVALIDDRVWIYEIKSSNEKKWLGLLAPSNDHLIQASIYFQAFNDLYLSGEFDHIPELVGKGKAVGVIWLYYNKNTSEIKQFTMTTEQLAPGIIALDKKIMKSNAYADAKVLPPKTLDYCNWCNYRKKCKKEWNEVDSE